MTLAKDMDSIRANKKSHSRQHCDSAQTKCHEALMWETFN